MQVKIKNWDINYEVLGEGEPVVFLHGWLTDLESMRPLTTELVKTHKIYLVDVVGFGKSSLPKEPLNSQDFAEFLKDNSDFYQAYKQSGIDTVVDDMSKRLKYMNNLYNDLIDKFESIENKLRRMDDISGKLEKLIDDTKDFKSGANLLISFSQFI